MPDEQIYPEIPDAPPDARSSTVKKFISELTKPKKPPKKLTVMQQELADEKARFKAEKKQKKAVSFIAFKQYYFI